MSLPFLIIVTGEPGSGKSTLAQILSKQICLPLVSRDRIKEGLVHTWQQSEESWPDNPNLEATELFFDTIRQMITSGCSLIAEAAFQHFLWEKYLTPFMESAKVRICLCAPGDRKTAHERFLERGLKDENRILFHGDSLVQIAKEGKVPAFPDYEPPHLPVPTFRIDTTEQYHPSLEELIPQLMDPGDVASFQTIETPHLVFRKAKDTDLAPIFTNIWSDQELARTMLWKPLTTLEEASRRMEMIKAFQSSSYSFFVCLKETNEPIGFAGIKRIGDGIYEETGICLARRFQGKGFGKEILDALIDLAFNQLNGRKLIYAAFQNNKASISLCRSFGFRYSHSIKEVRSWDGYEYSSDYFELERKIKKT